MKLSMRFHPLSSQYMKSLKEKYTKTTPENVKEANESLFYSKMNLPQAATHCGMTNKEMRLTFFEYLKYHPATYSG